jgi:hypothetical protein
MDQKKNQKNKNIKFIKKLISKSNYGIKTPDGIRPSLTKANLKKKYKKEITNKLINDHWENRKTLYFYGNENKSENLSLVMIDIDVNKKEKKGSLDGAKIFAEKIKEKIGDIYTELSTNGNGIHGYLIIDKCKKNANEVNHILKKFENYLRKEQEKENADIELVEIKGTLHEIEYKNKYIEKIKFGTLAKIPRDIESFLKYKNKEIKINEIEKKFSCELIKKTKKEGSISRKHISKEELLKLEYYEKISIELFGEKTWKTGKFTVNNKDISIFLLILNFFSKNKNIDNSTPTQRALMLWKKLYECEDIDRAWNHHRWKFIRDMFSKKGLINWIDNNYYFGDKTKGEKGVACKWELKEEVYMYQKKSEKEKRASLMDTNAVKSTKISDIKRLFNYKIPILCLFYAKQQNLYALNAINEYINKNFCYF